MGARVPDLHHLFEPREVTDMFTHHCTACDRRQLMFFSQVARALPLGTDGGLEVTFACWCGAEQTGALADATASATTAVERDLVAA